MSNKYEYLESAERDMTLEADGWVIFIERHGFLYRRKKQTTAAVAILGPARDELLKAKVEACHACGEACRTWAEACRTWDEARITWDKARLALSEHDKALEAMK